MRNVRKQFVLWSAVSVFVLLSVILAVINIINFTMAAQDADLLTERLLNEGGQFEKGPEPQGGWNPGFQGQIMGPDSPEMRDSLRYFAVRFDQEGNAQMVSFRISSLTEEEAVSLASGLVREKTGWVNQSYRFRTEKEGKGTLVIVIDQSRELLPSYRTLIISAIGLVAALAIFVVFLLLIGKRLFRPLEEADRKQKKFLVEAEKGFKVPLTVISADTDVIEREHGSSESTKSIHRQVKRMVEITKQLHSLSLLDENQKTAGVCSLSDAVTYAVDRKTGAFEEKGLDVELSVEPGVTVDGDSAALHALVQELVENALKFALTRASFRLENGEGIPKLTVSNDTNLKDGEADEVFDRFTRLENASGKPGSGLGLSYVKEIVRAHNGRLKAEVTDGAFTVRVTF